MPIDYRDATPDDAATLVGIGARTFIDTFGHLYDPRDLGLWLDGDHSIAAATRVLANPDYTTRFAVRDGRVAGYAMVCPNGLPFVDPARCALELKRLYIVPELKGAGVADALMAWVDGQATARDADDISLSVFSENPRAQRFYQRHGFAHAGQYHFLVGEQRDVEYVYIKRLR